MVPDDIPDLAAAVGLADAGPALARLARPAVRLEEAEDDRGRLTAGAGRSRYGGSPDLPPGTPWPRSPAADDGSGEPLVFVAQVDLTALPPPPAWAPASLVRFDGMLALFVEREDLDVWSGRVLALPDGVPLAPATAPDDLEEKPVGPGVPLRAASELTLPCPGGLLPVSEPDPALRSLGFDSLGIASSWTEERSGHIDAYQALHERLAAEQDLPDTVFGRLCGYPDMAQVSDPLLWAAARRLGVPDDRAIGTARCWRLLLQLVGLDGDSVYACLPEDRLVAADFRDVEVLSQYE